MSKPQRDHDADAPQGEKPSGTAGTSSTGAKPKHLPAKQPTKPLPHWRVILHNDDVNFIEDVVESIVMITPLGTSEAAVKTKLAHQSGNVLLLMTHQERAELYVQQFASRRLTVTIEPEE